MALFIFVLCNKSVDERGFWWYYKLVLEYIFGGVILSIQKNKKTKIRPDYSGEINKKMSEMSKGQKRGLWFFVALITVVLALLITLFVWKVLPRITNRVTSTAEGAAIKYISAVNERDFDKLCDSVVPSLSDGIKEHAEQNGGGDALMQGMFDSLKSDEQNPDFGDNITISIDEGSLSAEQQSFEDGKYNGQDMSEMNVSAVTLVKGNVTTKGSLNEDTQKVTFVCVKVDKSWYILTMTQTAEDTTWQQSVTSK